MLWDVSSPIMPTRWDFSWAGSDESSNRLVTVKVSRQRKVRNMAGAFQVRGETVILGAVLESLMVLLV